MQPEPLCERSLSTIKQLVTRLYWKDGLVLQFTAALHELQSKLPLMFAFYLVDGSFLMLLRIICHLPISSLPSLLQYVVQLFLHSLYWVFLSAFCLLLRATGKESQLLHLYPVSETGAASSEQGRKMLVSGDDDGIYKLKSQYQCDISSGKRGFPGWGKAQLEV